MSLQTRRKSKRKLGRPWRRRRLGRGGGGAVVSTVSVSNLRKGGAVTMVGIDGRVSEMADFLLDVLVVVFAGASVHQLKWLGSVVHVVVV